MFILHTTNFLKAIIDWSTLPEKEGNYLQTMNEVRISKIVHCIITIRNYSPL
jgi:hypothetical protein